MEPERMPGASPARPRRSLQDLPPVAYKEIQVGVFDLSDKEQLKQYQDVLNKLASGNWVRVMKEQIMPMPDRGKWMALIHYREVDWEKTKTQLDKEAVKG